MTSTESFDPMEHCMRCKWLATNKPSKARRMPRKLHHDLCPRNPSRKTYLELHNEVYFETIQKKNDENRSLKDDVINLHTVVSLQSSLIDNLLQQLQASSANNLLQQLQASSANIANLQFQRLTSPVVGCCPMFSQYLTKKKLTRKSPMGRPPHNSYCRTNCRSRLNRKTT
jgi:hypothetical protein